MEKRPTHLPRERSTEGASSLGFQHYQQAFTARIRDPKAHARPKGAPAKRMKVYEELLYNNLEGFLLACFPVCRKILGVRRWNRLVRGFFRDHTNHTPYFRQIPEEFLKYLQDEWVCPEGYPAFLPELAHYEWVELALDTSDRDRDVPPHDPRGDLLAGQPLANPVLRVLAYRWPVQRLSPRYKPAEPPADPTFLVAWRDQDLAVRFSVMNPATARLLVLIQESEGQTGRQILQALAGEMGHPDAVALERFGADQMATWIEQGILLGARQ